MKLVIKYKDMNGKDCEELILETIEYHIVLSGKQIKNRIVEAVHRIMGIGGQTHMNTDAINNELQKITTEK